MNFRSLNETGFRNVNNILRRGEHINLKLIKKAIKMNDELLKENFPKMTYSLKRYIVDLEELYKRDMERQEGFELNLDVDYHKDLSNETKMRECDSIFSDKFGNYSTEGVNICKCGKTETPLPGIKCPNCGTFTVNKVYKRGWIVISNGMKVFNPDYLSLILEYIDTKKPITKKYVKQSLEDTKNEYEYNIISLQERSKLIEFINLFIVDNMKEYFLNNIDKALTSKIPVISSKFRYYRVESRFDKNSKSVIRNHAYNKIYASISTYVKSLNSYTQFSSFTSRAFLLTHLNKKFVELYETFLSDLGKDKKASVFRGKTSGKHKPASAKLIISSTMSVEIDECILPYAIFGIISLKYYSKELKSLGLSTDGFKRIGRATPSILDKIILNKLLDLLKERNENIITSLRAPSIYLTSIVGLKIRALHDPLVLCLHEIVIGPLLAGDKDGDTSIICMPNPKIMVPLFMAYHPSKGVWSNITGFINSDYELPESNYYLAYDLFKVDDNRDLESKSIDAPSLVTDKSKIEELKKCIK